MSSQIGTLSEKSLHRALKRWYGQPGDQFEAEVDGCVIDIVRDGLLIEIQTRHLYSVKSKLCRLLDSHKILLVHPVPKEKWIVRQTAKGVVVGKRRSPKRGRPIDIFNEIVRIPQLLLHQNLTVDLLLTRQEEILRDDGKGSWRRKGWTVHDRRLLGVLEQISFGSAADYCKLLPSDLPTPFTNRDLATRLRCRPELARKMSYTLRKMGVLTVVGKEVNQYLHEISTV